MGLVIFVFLYIVSGWCSTFVFSSSRLPANSFKRVSSPHLCLVPEGGTHSLPVAHTRAEDLGLLFIFSSHSQSPQSLTRTWLTRNERPGPTHPGQPAAPQTLRLSFFLPIHPTSLVLLPQKLASRSFSNFKSPLDTFLALARLSGIRAGWGIDQWQIRGRKPLSFGWATFGWASCNLCTLYI